MNMEWLQTIFGVLLGGGLTILGGYIAQRRADSSAIERLKMEPLARACSELVARLDEMVVSHVVHSDTGHTEVDLGAMPMDDYSDLVGRISYWVSDKHSFEDLMSQAYLELVFGWPQQQQFGDERVVGRAFDIATTYKMAFTTALTRLPFSKQLDFHSELREAASNCKTAKTNLRKDIRASES